MRGVIAVPCLVRLGVGEKVRAVVVPEPVRVFGAEHRGRPWRRHHHKTRFAAVRTAFRLVQVAQRGVGDLGLEAEVESGGAQSSSPGAAAVEQHRVGLGQRRRSHLHCPSFELERFSTPRDPKNADQSFDIGASTAPRPTELCVLVGQVPEPERVRHPTPAEVVEDGDVLGQSQRVVQIRDKRRHCDRDPRRSRGERRRHQHRTREVAVGRTVVLRQHQGVLAVGVEVLRLLHRPREQFAAGGGGGAWSSEVESSREECHRTTLSPLPASPSCAS